MKFRITDWQPHRAGAVYGFATVQFDEYLTVTGIAVRDGKNGRWAAMPSREWTGKDGKRRFDPIVAFPDKDTTFRFSDALVTRLEQQYPDDFA